jgi:uncharacterized repeat protein (TIGR03803 family)
MGKLDWRYRACAAVLLWATAPIGLPAQTFKTIHRFDGTDGSSGPYVGIAGLVQATGGNLYGTTGRGESLLGTVFKISPGGGPVKTLYSFSGFTDGQFPAGGLVQGTQGNFYGTTCGGACGASGEHGTIFKITPSGTLTTLYSFCPQGFPCTDGDIPQAGLVQATNGNFYGTTVAGGANATGCLGGDGCGTVFKISPSGTLTTLYSFCSQSGCTDGNSPNGLVQATNGNLYGTTNSGGALNLGTVFRITPSGTLTTLHHFKRTDGANPAAALVQAADGNFYGTTDVGGAKYEGTVFEITPSGTLTTLYSFCSQGGTACTDGDRPEAALVQATDGNFYGTTHGRTFDNESGTVFKITPGGTLTTLYSFCSQGGTACTDGAIPSAGLVQDTNGMFYGTTSRGGLTNCFDGCGTVFSLSVGLGPFVKTQPASARVGGFVQILGTNLTGATSVSFNGTPAVFRVVLNSWIKTTVPAGATTGTVEVVTPGGTLASNVPFRVRP